MKKIFTSAAILLFLTVSCRLSVENGGDSGSATAPVQLSPASEGTYYGSAPTLSWSAPSQADSFRVQVSKTDNSFSGTKLIVDSSTGTKTSIKLTGLTNSTKYYWRVYTKLGTTASAWAGPIYFTTQFQTFTCGSQITYNSITYNTVLIGSQCWMKENLNIGTMILSNLSMSNNGTIEKYCYNDNPVFCDTYGGLYQWNEAMNYAAGAGIKGICPQGWHIPTKYEYEQLASSAASSNALKAVGEGTGPGSGTNASGFTALLGGYRDTNGFLNGRLYNGYFWTSDIYDSYNSYYFGLNYSTTSIDINSYSTAYGFSIRCIKD